MSEPVPTVCRMTRRRLVAAAAVGAAAVVFELGLMHGHGAAAQTAGYSIALIPGEGGSSFFYVPMACGAQDAADELGVTLSVKAPAYWDALLQTALLKEVVAAKPDAILIVPIDSAALIAPIQAAIDAGIAVFTLDTTIDAGIVLATIASDNVEGGRIAARALAEAIGEQGKVFVVTGPEVASSVTDREAGFAEAIADFPGIEYLGLERDDFQDASTIVAAKLDEVPDLAGVFGTYLPAGQGAGIAVANAGVADTVKVVAFDAGPEQVTQLEAGDVAALIAQHPYEMGYQGVQLAAAYLNSGQPPAESFVATGFTVVTADNLEDAETARNLYVLSCDDIPAARAPAAMAATPVPAATPAAAAPLAEFVREIVLGVIGIAAAPGDVAVATDGATYVIDS